MDKGEFVKSEFRVVPAENGGILCVEGRSHERGYESRIVAFSCTQDFLQWLEDEYSASRPHSPKEIANMFQEKGIDPAIFEPKITGHTDTYFSTLMNGGQNG